MSREEDLFGAALDLPPAERSAFLDEACADDAELRGQVEALLAGHEAAQSFLESSASLPGTVLPAEKPGDLISSYVLRRKIGEGGCGVVWLAEQTAPVRRLVALKVIKLGMDTRNVIARFEAERQVLALMEHSDIARVFDAGSTASGRPFFVMEYVDGVPITRFCDEQNMPVTGRLALFARVCQAVQHAHQKGIIHRDLKPSNVLVSLQDGVPVPKVIDFGIAKATEGRLTDATALTALEQFIGTPAYMSPEQATMSSLDIDTRSDIYSLGVLLYELLTGRTPFETKDLLQIGLDEIRRHIREVEPPRPSTRLHTLEAAKLATTAQHRDTEPPRLIHVLQGDLDWIVMRCLEKDRIRRYDTATSLAQDLQRHLNHEPIEARPAGPTYRFRKMVRRNRLLCGAVAAVALALVLGVVGSTWQALRANRAEKLARNEAAVSQAVNQFLISDLLRQADSAVQADTFETPNPDLKVREALDRAAAHVGERFDTQPLAEAAVRLAIGESYLGLGLSAQAIPELERAEALRSTASGPDNPATLAARAPLARAYTANGKFNEAATLQRAIMDAQIRQFGPESLALDLTRNDLADTLEAQGKYADASALHRITLAHRESVLGPEHPDTLWSVGNLGNTYLSEGKNDLAEPLQLRAYTLRRKVLGPDHPSTLNATNNLATTYNRIGKRQQALDLDLELLTTLRRVVGPDHIQTITALVNLAAVYLALENYPEAEKLNAEAREKARQVLGPDSPLFLVSTNNLSNTLSKSGRTNQAITLQEQLIVDLSRVFGPEHPNTLSTKINLGSSYNDIGRPEDAIPFLTSAADGLTKVLGPDHRNTLFALSNLAASYESLKRYPEAIALRETLLERQIRVFGPMSSGSTASSLSLAAAYEATGNPAASIKVRLDLLNRQREARGSDDPGTQQSLAIVSTLMLANHDYASAEPLLRELLAVRQKAEPNEWSTFNTQSALGGSLLGQDQLADAEPLLLAGYEGLQRHREAIPLEALIRVQETLERLVRLYTILAQPDQLATWQARLDAFLATRDATSP